MSFARTDTADQRSAIYRALAQRNRIVGVLRFGLPVIGGVVLGGLLLQIYLGSLVPDFGFANISIDRDNLVVDTPSYSGIGTDGTRYRVEAASARAAFGNTDLIYMNGARFTMEQPGGSTFLADADTAQFRLSDQEVTVSGETRISGDSGISGKVVDARIDIDAQRLDSSGPADLLFANGTTIKASSMTYEGVSQVWSFRGVTLDIPSTPGEDTYDLRPGNDLVTGSEEP